jgi:hypothetical protein
MVPPHNLTALCILAVLCLGCGKGEQIEHYTVLKPPPMQTPAGFDPHAGLNFGERPNVNSMPADSAPAGEPTDRTLAAIVTVGEQGWFFKLTGPRAVVEDQVEPFDEFLRSVRFSASGKPEWKLPDGWRQTAGNDIRFATLLIPSAGKSLELSVTVLPKSGDDANYALVNINRWRGQLRLPPIAADQLASESTEVPLDGVTARVVDLLGIATAGGMGGPFSSGARNGN